MFLGAPSASEVIVLFLLFTKNSWGHFAESLPTIADKGSLRFPADPLGSSFKSVGEPD